MVTGFTGQSGGMGNGVGGNNVGRKQSTKKTDDMNDTTITSNGGVSGGKVTATNNGRRRPRQRRGRSSSSGITGSSSSSSSRSMGSLLPVLLLVALLFYVFGFIQSIRHLPDLDPSEFTHLNPILGRAVLDYTRNIQNKIRHKNNKGNNNEDGNNNAVLDKYNEIMKGGTNNNNDNYIAGNLRGGENDNKESSTNDNNDLSGNIFVPEAKWPVTIKDEVSDDTKETIIHPGDESKTMTVPKFWSRPVMKPNDTNVMSKETALKITSYDTTNGKLKGTPESRTIFIAIASYRDFECRETVDSIFQRAKYPERVRVAVTDQLVVNEDIPCHEPFKPCEEDPTQMACKYARQIDVFEMDAALAVGPVFARHIGHRLYRGEYYAMQIDAHVTFVTDWDVDIIEQLEATHNDMAVLSTYLTDVVGSIDPVTGGSKRKTRPIMCNTDYESGVQGAHLRHLSQPERRPPIDDMPQMQPYWAAGWSFSRGHFVVNVPYDLYQPMIFQGEESSIGIRGWTYGYDHYAPQRSICFHTYAQGENAGKRGKVPHFWQNANHYAGKGKVAMKRLLGIIGMLPEIDPSTWDHREEDIYGCGSVRPKERFFETFGIDVHKKRVEHHLCSFVQGGKMHRDFQSKLRPDGMGVDYSKIDYKFKDPHPEDKHQMLE